MLPVFRNGRKGGPLFAREKAAFENSEAKKLVKRYFKPQKAPNMSVSWEDDHVPKDVRKSLGTQEGGGHLDSSADEVTELITLCCGRTPGSLRRRSPCSAIPADALGVAPTASSYVGGGWPSDEAKAWAASCPPLLERRSLLCSGAGATWGGSPTTAK